MLLLTRIKYPAIVLTWYPGWKVRGPGRSVSWSCPFHTNPSRSDTMLTATDLTSAVLALVLRLATTMCPAAPPMVSIPDNGHRITWGEDLQLDILCYCKIMRKRKCSEVKSQKWIVLKPVNVCKTTY